MKGIYFVALSALALAGCKPSLAVANQRLLDACHAKDLAGVQSALAAGADPNARGPARGFSALDVGCESPDIVAVLLKAGAAPAKPDKNGIPAVAMAAALGSPRSLQLMLEAGASVEATGPNGNTLLSFAVGAGRIDNVTVLLSHGAKVNAPDRFGRTALFDAATGWNKVPVRIAMVRLLLAHGANPRVKDVKGHTAADSVDTKVMRYLGANSELVRLLRDAEKSDKG